MAKYKWCSPNKSYEIEVEAENFKDAFKQLSEFQEVVSEAEGRGAQMRVREVTSGKKTHTYYELWDRKTNKALTLGQHLVGGTVYPQRKWPEKHANAGEFKPDNGWVVWEKPVDEEEVVSDKKKK